MEFLKETTYVDQAKDVMDALFKPQLDRNGREKKPQLVTMSKIRNILSMAADIYDNVMRVSSQELGPDLVSRIEYLRVRMIYESGREPKVKTFLEAAHLLDYVKMIGNDKKKFILFYHYLEALVAFHRFNGGKDN